MATVRFIEMLTPHARLSNAQLLRYEQRSHETLCEECLPFMRNVPKDILDGDKIARHWLLPQLMRRRRLNRLLEVDRVTAQSLEF